MVKVGVRVVVKFTVNTNLKIIKGIGGVEHFFYKLILFNRLLS